MSTNKRFELPQLTPLNFSLTDGTDIPPPLESPIREEPEPAPEPVSTIRKVADEPITPTTSGSASKTAIGTDDGLTNVDGSEHGNLNVATSSEGVYDGRRIHSASHTNVSTDSRPPMSPVSVNASNSIRRFLSRNSLNARYENGTTSNSSHEDLTKIDRPESSLSFVNGSKTGKKSRTSWFKRFSSKNKIKEQGKRGSVIYEDMKPQAAAPVPARAPVPAPAPAPRPAPVIQRPKGPPAPKLPELNRLKAQMNDEQGSLGGGDMFANIK